MKKYIILIFIAIAFTFVSCSNDTEPGGTAVQDMSGEWWVTCTFESTPGVWEDAVGHVRFSTYNTAANKSTEMLLDDLGNIWPFKSVVDVDYAAKTFSTKTAVSTNDSAHPTLTVLIKDGKVLKGAAKTPSGLAADSIVFYSTFSDDPTTVYKISGFRRTGFPEDDFE